MGHARRQLIARSVLNDALLARLLQLAVLLPLVLEEVDLQNARHHALVPFPSNVQRNGNVETVPCGKDRSLDHSGSTLQRGAP